MRMLVLCQSRVSAPPGFVWPRRGPIAGRFRGWPWGEGDGSEDTLERATWFVVSAKNAHRTHGQVRFASGDVVFAGTRAAAVTFLLKNGAAGRAVIHAKVTASEWGSACAGDHGIAVAGAFGTAAVGNMGRATAGDDGVAIAGHNASATAGDRGRAMVKDWAVARAGFCGTAIAGEVGRAIVGKYGTAVAGDAGTAIAGGYGTATAGIDGMAMAGERGTIVLRWFDREFRDHLVIGSVGKQGILADVPYALDAEHRLVPTKLPRLPRRMRWL
jgi:hypothetical protein